MGERGQSAVNFQVLLPQVLGKLRSLCRVPSSFLSFCLSFINWKTFLSKLCHFLCERQTPLFSDSTSEVFGFNRANAFPAVLRSARQEFISACKAASVSASRGICRVQFKLNSTSTSSADAEAEAVTLSSLSQPSRQTN